MLISVFNGGSPAENIHCILFLARDQSLQVANLRFDGWENNPGKNMPENILAAAQSLVHANKWRHFITKNYQHRNS